MSSSPSLNLRQHSSSAEVGADDPPSRIPQPSVHPPLMQRSHSLRLRTDLPDIPYNTSSFQNGTRFGTDASTNEAEIVGGGGGGGDCDHKVSSKSAPVTNTDGCVSASSYSPESKENRPAAGQYRRVLPLTQSLTSPGGGASPSPGMAHHHHGHSNGGGNHHNSCNHQHSHGESCGPNHPTSNTKQSPGCTICKGSASNGGSRHRGMVSLNTTFIVSTSKREVNHFRIFKF